jgi:hypothetical protein
MASRWSEKNQLIAVEADHTMSAATRKRASGGWRRTSQIPVSRGSGGAIAASPRSGTVTTALASRAGT